MKKKKSLGNILVEQGSLTTGELEKAIDQQKIITMHLGELLLTRNVVQKEELIPAIEEVTNCKYIDCQAVEVMPEVLNLVPFDIARRNCAFPVEIVDGKLVVAMSIPQQLSAIDELEFASGKSISPRLGFENEIRDAINRWYGETEDTEKEDDGARFLELDNDDFDDMEFFSSGFGLSFYL